ncbi:MAG: hypothetical protein Q4B95_02460 [Lonepinella koalarum]|nr:hypothetical protein [Lonepinella koalarum]
MAVKKHFLKKRNPLFRLNQARRNLRITRIRKQQQRTIDRNALYFVVQNCD